MENLYCTCGDHVEDSDHFLFCPLCNGEYQSHLAKLQTLLSGYPSWQEKRSNFPSCWKFYYWKQTLYIWHWPTVKVLIVKDWAIVYIGSACWPIPSVYNKHNVLAFGIAVILYTKLLCLSKQSYFINTGPKHSLSILFNIKWINHYTVGTWETLFTCPYT